VRRALGFVAVVGIVVLGPAVAASAHPLGNFTVNQYSGLLLGRERVAIDYVVDMAEIPTFQTRGEVAAAGASYAGGQCRRLAGGLRLAVDERPLALRLDTSALAFPPGTAGLPTLRLTCRYSTPGSAGSVSFRNVNYADRVGWREITAAGDGVTITSTDVPRRSASERLTRYPQDLLQSPLDQRAAAVRARPGGTAAALPARLEGPARALPRGVDRATRAFTSLVSRHHLSPGFGALAVGLALALGAIHALAPGHGKTVMAAYLVGQRGSLRQAALIGLTVTATHTAGVLALGLALSASALVAPERLYPWLGLASGALLAVIGAGLLRRAVRARRHRRHHHHHHPHEHDAPPVGLRALIAMGFAGGLVPSPSALVVLLGAIALGRAWFGVVLVIAYGLGMAATLTGAGVLLLRARRALDRRAEGRAAPSRLLRLTSALPVATSSVIVVVGVALAARGAAGI
jgi:ABC-type nickel/cobalt efflux system permease component RcnA